jgi:hypothetical protein
MKKHTQDCLRQWIDSVKKPKVLLTEYKEVEVIVEEIKTE